MRAVGSLLPLLIIGTIAFAVTRARAKGAVPPGPSARDIPAPAPPAARSGLEGDLERWVAAGLVTERQRAAILAHERGPGTAEGPAVAAPAAPALRARRIPAVAEALGYLGGILAVTGLGLVLSRYCPDMATGGRLALSGVAALGLLAAGGLAQEQADPALARLRWFLWLAATAATALFAGVLALDGLGAADETVALACAAAVTALSALLWRGRDRPIQQLTLMGGIAVTAGTATAEIATGVPIGLAPWAVGVTLVALGLRRATTEPVLTEAVGALAVLAGGFIAASGREGVGFPLVVLSAFGLLALANVGDVAPDRADRQVLGIPAALALTQAVPATLIWFSQEAAGITGLVTWVAGGLLLLAGARGRVRLPVQAELLGGAGLIGGAAITGAQWEEAAPLFGIVTAVALLVWGMRPDQVVLSMLGAVGLLVNVPWAIGVLFPGEGRAPLLIMVSGALIIAIAVLLTRRGGRVRDELGTTRRRPPRGGVAPRPSS
jgi:hypothetical protein